MKNLLIFLMVMAISGCGGESKEPASTRATIQNESDSQNSKANKDQQVTNDGTLIKNTETKSGDKQTTKDEQVLANDGTTVEKNETTKSGNKQTINTKQDEPQNKSDGQTNSTKNRIETNSNDATPAGNKLADNSTGSFTDNGDKASVYIGVFAQWNLKDGSQFDGSYDTAHSLFYLCDSKSFRSVSRKEVVFKTYASCDEVKKQIMLIRRVTGGGFKPYPGVIQLQGSKGIIKNGNEIRVIQFTPATINRINKTAILQKTNTLQLIPEKISPKKQVEIIQPKTEVKMQIPVVQPKTEMKTFQPQAEAKMQTPVVQPKAETKTFQPQKEIKMQTPVVQPKIEAKIVQPQTQMKVQTLPMKKVLVDTPKPATKMKMTNKMIVH